jgi:hypothetical protein
VTWERPSKPAVSGASSFWGPWAARLPPAVIHPPTAVTATDPDVGGAQGDALTYSWSSAANMTDPPASATKFKCTMVGLSQITITVTHGAATMPCSVMQTFTVDCVDRI